MNDYLLGIVASAVAGSLIPPFLCQGLASSGSRASKLSFLTESPTKLCLCICILCAYLCQWFEQSHTIHNRHNIAGIGLGRSSHVLALDGIFHSFFLNRKWRMS